MSVDPTKIDIEYEVDPKTDPRVRMQDGVARHGRTPFYCPIISHIAGNLWQGGCFNGLVLPSEIVHIVSLYKWEQYTIPHEMRSVTTIEMYDSEDQGMQQVEDIAAWTYSCVKDAPTLVHCQAGLNRSGLIAGRVLMLSGLSADDAISIMRGSRSPAVLCNRAFADYLRSKDPIVEMTQKVVDRQQRQQDEQDAGL